MYLLWSILLIVWAVSGAILSAFYTALAAGTVEHFLVTVVIGPPVTLGMIVLYIFAKAEARSHRGRKDGLVFFRVVVAYICLPILLNGVSHMAAWAGLLQVSEIAFAFRYTSIPLLLLGGVLASSVVGIFVNLRNRIMKLWRRGVPG